MTTQNMPVLALRGLTAFPGQTLSFDAEREISILALENAMEGDRELLTLYCFAHLSGAELAAALGVTPAGRQSPSSRPTWTCWRTRVGGPRTAPRP